MSKRNPPLNRYDAWVEADALRRINHSGVISLLDMRDEVDNVYLMLEWLTGQSLENRKGNPLTWTEARPIFYRVAEAVRVLHEAGIIHGDIHPGNVHLPVESGVKILDLGGRCLIHTPCPYFLAAGGIPEYTAPEKMISTKRTARPTVDIFSLGVLLGFMLSGQHPFFSDYYWPHVPRGTRLDVFDFIRRATARDPYDRLQSVNELFAVLPGI